MLENIMVQLGILTNSYTYPTLESTLDAVSRQGLSCVQFEPITVGIPDDAEQIDPERAACTRQALADRGLVMAALSGTVNMVHPNPQARAAGMHRLRALIEASESFGTRVVTLCTGSRSAESMWRRHPNSDTPEAWADLVVSMREAVAVAGRCGVTLAFEPEVNNVVDSAQKARRLIDEIGSAHLGVVMDPANIFHTGELPRMAEMLDEAFALLGPHIALAHAKDLDHDGDAGHLPAGQGVLDYRRYMQLLHASGFNGGLILHGLTEQEVPQCAAAVRAAAPSGWF
jgi:sugar phosphate isomerase/epimerase